MTALEATVLSAAVAGKDALSVTIQLQGRIERPGTRAEVERVVIVATVPATVLPA